MPYSHQTVTVASTTVPVQLMPPGAKTTWLIRPRSNATVTILAFAYSGALPGSAPANVQEVGVGQPLSDEDHEESYKTDSMQQGWAAVLSAAGSTVVDSTWRP